MRGGGPRAGKDPIYNLSRLAKLDPINPSSGVCFPAKNQVNKLWSLSREEATIPCTIGSDFESFSCSDNISVYILEIFLLFGVDGNTCGYSLATPGIGYDRWMTTVFPHLHSFLQKIENPIWNILFLVFSYKYMVKNARIILEEKSTVPPKTAKHIRSSKNCH